MKGKRACVLVLCLCLLAGCARRGGEKKGPAATPPPTVAPTPTAAPTPEPVETAEPTPTPPPKQELPLGAMLLLELEETDRVMDKATGDLNGDGVEDWAVVAERPSKAEEPGEYFTDAPRTLAILLGDGKGGFYLGQTNDHFIRRDTQGGVFGDPYEGIYIQNGELHYKDYGGSAWKWGNDYAFSWQGDGLALTGLETMSRYGERGVTESYDFLAGEYTQRAFSEGAWDCGTGLLWEQDISAEFLRLEDMPNAWEGEPWREQLPPLPDLKVRFYGYEEGWSGDKGPEEILDGVRKERFPDMSRVELSWTEETRSNYAKAMGGEVPGYYYADGEGRLSWFAGSSVIYESWDGETMEFY